MKNQKGISTPLGIIPRKLAHPVMSQGGFKFVDGQWVILTYETREVKAHGKIRDYWLPVKMWNFEIALSQSRIKHNTPANTEEVVEHAIKNNAGSRYLPKQMGYSSYSKLCEHIAKQERNFFSLAENNRKSTVVKNNDTLKI